MSKSASQLFCCVSLNPAIDKRIHVDALVAGRVNRVSKVRAAPGGKAAHVAMVLRTLGADPWWLGFSGGATGEQLLSGLRDLGIRTQSIAVSENTRVNLEIIDNAGSVTELLEPGPTITDKDWKRFIEVYEKLLSELSSSGTVIASGSAPPGAKPGAYAELTELAHRHGHKMFLDTSGEPLRLALSAGPDLVKPNREEAESLIGEKIGDLKAAKIAVGRLIELGAKSAVVSLGREGFVWQPGALLDVYHAQPPNVKVISSVGCGDATVAALGYAMAAGFDAEKTLQLASACGAANCLADAPGRLREMDVQALQHQVRIEKLAR